MLWPNLLFHRSRVIATQPFHHDLLYGALFVLFPYITLKCQPSQIRTRVTITVLLYFCVISLPVLSLCICFILRHSCHFNFYSNHLSNPFKILLFSVVSVCVSMWACACDCRCLCRQEASEPPGPVVARGCELPGFSDQDWTQVLSKSNMSLWWFEWEWPP